LGNAFVLPRVDHYYRYAKFSLQAIDIDLGSFLFGQVRSSTRPLITGILRSMICEQKSRFR
jgi:hypothetical protein